MEEPSKEPTVNWVQWIVGILLTVLLASVAGAFGGGMRLASVETDLREHKIFQTGESERVRLQVNETSQRLTATREEVATKNGEIIQWMKAVEKRLEGIEKEMKEQAKTKRRAGE